MANMGEFVGESPKSRFARDLALKGADNRSAMARTLVGEGFANKRQKMQNTTSIQNKYVEAMVAKDKQDYDTALKMYQDLGNLPKNQQELFKQTEGFKQMSKIFKRVQLPVFDDNGEVVFPSSKADAMVETKATVQKVLEDIRAKRKPNQQELGNIIGALNNAREVAGSEQESQKLDKLIGFFENQLGEQAGVDTVNKEDPLGLLGE